MCMSYLDIVYFVTHIWTLPLLIMEGSNNPNRADKNMDQHQDLFFNYRTRAYSQGRQSRKRFCHICQRGGHETRECWFNGRSTGRQERYYP